MYSICIETFAHDASRRFVYVRRVIPNISAHTDDPQTTPVIRPRSPVLVTIYDRAAAVYRHHQTPGCAAVRAAVSADRVGPQAVARWSGPARRRRAGRRTAESRRRRRYATAVSGALLIPPSHRLAHSLPAGRCITVATGHLDVRTRAAANYPIQAGRPARPCPHLYHHRPAGLLPQVGEMTVGGARSGPARHRPTNYLNQHTATSGITTTSELQTPPSRRHHGSTGEKSSIRAGTYL